MTDQQQARDAAIEEVLQVEAMQDVLPTPDELSTFDQYGNVVRTDEETLALVMQETSAIMALDFQNFESDQFPILSKILKDEEADLRCPITRELLIDPVIAEDNKIYERTAIEQWLRAGNRKSPLTGIRMGPRLVPDAELRMALLVRQQGFQGRPSPGWYCPVPVGMQCAVKALVRAHHQFNGQAREHADVLQELLLLNLDMAPGDKATAEGFTDAHIVQYLDHNGIDKFIINQQQYRRNLALLRPIPVVFNTGRHWSADRQQMASSQLFYFLGQQPAGLVLVELLEDPANADQVASMRELGLNDEAIREILGGGEPFNVELFQRFVSSIDDEFAWAEDPKYVACTAWEDWIDFCLTRTRNGTDLNQDDDTAFDVFHDFCLTNQAFIKEYGPIFINQNHRGAVQVWWERFRQHHASKSACI
eukprot:SAG11_NODE_1415_length_4977_cov_6.362444_4_plen_421_part_00